MKPQREAMEVGLKERAKESAGYCSAVHFFTSHKNDATIEFFFKRVNATVLIKSFNLKALDSTIRDVSRKLV